MTGGWVWALRGAHAADALEDAEGDPGNALEGAEGDPPSSSTPSTALARPHTREEPSPFSTFDIFDSLEGVEGVEGVGASRGRARTRGAGPADRRPRR